MVGPIVAVVLVAMLLALSIHIVEQYSVVSARQYIDDRTAQRLRDIVTELERSPRDIQDAAFASRVHLHRVDDITLSVGT